MLTRRGLLAGGVVAVSTRADANGNVVLDNNIEILIENLRSKCQADHGGKWVSLLEDGDFVIVRKVHAD